MYNPQNFKSNKVFTFNDLQSLSKQSGIYCIVHTRSNKCYVGSSVNIFVRLNQYLSKSYRARHSQTKIVRVLNKYGSDEFIIIILEFCAIQDLILKEQYWIDSIKPVLNIAKYAGNTLGVKASLVTRQKISKIALARESLLNPEFLVSVLNLKTKLIKHYKSLTEVSNLFKVNRGVLLSYSGFIFKNTYFIEISSKLRENLHWYKSNKILNKNKYSSRTQVILKSQNLDYPITTFKFKSSQACQKFLNKSSLFIKTNNNKIVDAFDAIVPGSYLIVKAERSSHHDKIATKLGKQVKLTNILDGSLTTFETITEARKFLNMEHVSIHKNNGFIVKNLYLLELDNSIVFKDRNYKPVTARTLKPITIEKLNNDLAVERLTFRSTKNCAEFLAISIDRLRVRKTSKISLKDRELISTNGISPGTYKVIN